jgi:hypothetical protein
MRTVPTLTRALALFATVAAATSCGDVVRSGTSPAYLVLDSMAGGAKSTAVLNSDVITNVTTPAPCSAASPCPTVFSDAGQATMHLALKDPAAQTAPSQFNAITVDRYHIEYARADGRNTQGVDVPYSWDGAVTVTVAGNTPSVVAFELVRVAAKEEAPLIQLRNSNQVITVIAKVTFYGHDQVGNQTSVTGNIQIDFGNFGDSQ